MGWLHGEGYIESLADLLSLRPCATDLGFWAEIPAQRLAAVQAEHRAPVLASGCGAVSVFLADPSPTPRGTARGDPPATDTLRGLFRQLFTRGVRYQTTGGIHAAGLTDGASVLHHAEDIGRHNAVDKVIGWALASDMLPLSNSLMMVSGRGGLEIVQKALVAGVPVLASVSAPSDLAVKLAREFGMTLVGFLRGRRFVIYSGARRLAAAPALRAS